MFLEIVRSEGLSQVSYVFGDGGQAAVIDPRRDCKVYVEIARRNGARIAHIFETHRHEDFVVGSLELARRTGAKIRHGAALPFGYGEFVKDGESFTLGSLKLKILETPGHTPESICIALYDTSAGDKPLAVFTGDTLFMGDTGRTDFYAERREELSGKLYDSIHGKLLPLGDHVVLYPGHGQGSVCGGGIAAREISTLGYERQFSPLLRKTRAEFIRHKMAEEHFYSPYFRRMEKLNQEGVPLVAKLPEPRPEGVESFAAATDKKSMIVLDTRSPEAFSGAHIPGSLCIPLGMVPGFAGMFLPFDRDIGLVLDRAEDAEKARIFLMRMGYDNVTRYLEGGINAWAESGRPFSRIPAVHVEELEKRLSSAPKETLLLDVRSRAEYAARPSAQSMHIYIGNLEKSLDALPRDKKIIAFCGTGRRAAIAASVLQRAGGFRSVEVCLGSMAAIMALGKAHIILPEAA